MSTQSYTPNQQASYEPSNQQASYEPSNQQGGGRSWFRIWAMIIGTVVAAALVVVAVATLHGHSSAAPATTGPSTSASAPANPTTPGTPTTPTSPVTPSHPVTPVQPSTAVMQLQRELGQLNYYEGPVDGIMGPQTTAAIKDLQRQAGLPQTGQMNAATQAALANFLAHGNNQMGGNS